MSISHNENKAAHKILCIGGSTLNEGTPSKIKDALVKTNFLEEWAVIFVNHLYFFVYGYKYHSKQPQDYIEKIKTEWDPIKLFFVDTPNTHLVEKNTTYILPDPDIYKTESGWNQMKMCLVVNCKVENNLVKLEAVQSKGIDKKLADWLEDQNMFDASNNSRLKDYLNEERLELPCIDKFMIELADVKTKIQQDVRIAGLILCGCDGDGAYGLKEIKDKGGKTAVQYPDECSHPIKRNTWSMPDTAIKKESKHQIISIEGKSGVTNLTDWLKSIR